ncbi:hypothetical protein M413DRAFT_77141 [Hebeloma cylindrosporum]|uniref:Protein kinase domain-containing protein n=1 Tax=Hebeloma cylindrosporum TaxID=76867 RepID=A0A0C3BL22_HEBCY|nr:hypothetical protein M413DRAFT_77141 [Hebeloma cylindrosporum h7]
MEKGGVEGAELYWRANYHWFLDRGYQLRPRYSPDWIPSWTGTSKYFEDCEDGIYLRRTQICDAVHVPTGALVVLKRTDKTFYPREAAIMQYLSSEPLASDPRNHCPRLMDVFEPPVYKGHTTQILFMPLLRPFHSPTFDTVGEGIDCFRQLFEGLQFLHEHHIAHRDLNINNFMMEWTNMFPEGFHPQADRRKKDMSGPAPFFTRTQRPTRYIIIDFGMSTQYNPGNLSPREKSLIGGDKTVPEFLKGEEYHDPYKTDIYYVGNLIRTEFMQGHPIITDIPGYKGFDFMKPLIDDMVQDDPSKRPSMDEVVQRFEELVQGLTQWKLGAWAAPRRKYFFRRMRIPIDIASHWKRKMIYILRKIPAIPTAGA